MKNELESYFHLRFSLLPLTENLKSLRSGKRISIHFLELSSFVFLGDIEVKNCKLSFVFFILCFLDASSHLYMRVCPSVGWSVRRSVGHAFVKNGKIDGFDRK